jgi:hypothetical protein
MLELSLGRVRIASTSAAVGLRHDLNCPGTRIQMLLLDCLVMLVGLFAVGGLAGTDWMTRSLGGAMMFLGATLALLSYRRFRGD